MTLSEVIMRSRLTTHNQKNKAYGHVNKNTQTTCLGVRWKEVRRGFDQGDRLGVETLPTNAYGPVA